MIIALDTYYYDGDSYTVGGIFDSWVADKVSYYVTSKRECIDAEYKPGELYKRELPCIMQCLSMVNLDNVDTIIVDGFVWLSDDGKTLKAGLGQKLHETLSFLHGKDITIVGVAKNKYHSEIPHCYEIKHGLESDKPLYVTCSNPNYAEHYSLLVSRMHGDYRIPTILKAVDTKTRSFKKDDVEEIVEEEPSSPIGLDLSDLDKWAEENLATKKDEETPLYDAWAEYVKENGDKVDINEFMDEVEKRGFLYK